MADEEKIGYYQMTQPATMSFPNLTVAKAVKLKGKETGEPKFSANIEMSVEHADLNPMKALAAKVARAKWPTIDLKTLAFPFTSGDKLADKAKANGKDREFSRGKVILTSRSQFPPQLCTVVNGALVDVDENNKATLGGHFYNGVDALVEVNFVAYDAVGNGQAGVTAYLQKVCSLNRGTKLSGGQSAAEVFKGYVGLKSSVDPTAGGLDDEIPF